MKKQIKSVKAKNCQPICNDSNLYPEYAETKTWDVPEYQEIGNLFKEWPIRSLTCTYDPTYSLNNRPKKEKNRMLLPFAFAASAVRKAAWSVFDWAFVSPVKKTLSPVNTLLQFAVCYGTIAAVVYLGYRGY